MTGRLICERAFMTHVLNTMNLELRVHNTPNKQHDRTQQTLYATKLTK